MAVTINFEDPLEYSRNSPIHSAIYGYNGIGKTTFAGKTPLRTCLLDCGDSGAVTLRKEDPKRLRIVRIKTISHYLDVIGELISKPDDIDLLVPDTITGLQSLAIREVKGKKGDMNQRKWGLVSSKVIECLSETRNFPKDVIYLIQERRKTSEDEADNIMPGLTPSCRGALSSLVDFVGYLSITEGEDKDGNTVIKRTIDFRITPTLEAKDRASIFPKLLVNASYLSIRKRIVEELHTNK
jgi:AAA domain-containing protein